MAKNVLILGAAGRDFHNFNMLFRNNKDYNVVAFTAAQIPYIENRVYPTVLAGKQYKKGIPIFGEGKMRELIEKHKVDICVQAYSDLRDEEVMDKASIANAAGADFWLVSPEHTMLKSKKPVIAVCAVRTGSGKSQVSRYIAVVIKKTGKTPVVIRHPMPYGDLAKKIVERYASVKDLDRHKTTIEEREDYEPHIKNRTLLYSGVDYEKVLKAAEKEADIIIWDGGNNDAPFIKPDLMVTVADPLRAGDELTYYPGETVARMADILIINKVNSASTEDVERVKRDLQSINKKATVVLANSVISVDNKALIKNKRVLVMEDGPTITHGGMKFGAASVAAENYGARLIIDAKKYAVGSIKKVYEKYPHLERILPAVGYSKQEIAELNATINRADCDSVVSASPIDLRRVLDVNKPIANVRYELEERGNYLKDAIIKFVNRD